MHRPEFVGDELIRRNGFGKYGGHESEDPDDDGHPDVVLPKAMSIFPVRLKGEPDEAAHEASGENVEADERCGRVKIHVFDSNGSSSDEVREGRRGGNSKLGGGWKDRDERRDNRGHECRGNEKRSREMGVRGRCDGSGERSKKG